MGPSAFEQARLRIHATTALGTLNLRFCPRRLMASGAGAAAAPAAEAAGAAPAGRGCYLVRTEENSGTLYACWSETVVEGAIAYTSPRKAVPKFKFNQRGGKNELKRGLGGPLIKNYYQDHEKTTRG